MAFFMQLDTIGNHWKLAPVAAGSYWSVRVVTFSFLCPLLEKHGTFYREM
eukprot:SAG31_NODE_28_length_32713_cov_39.100509_15_plen_50_part_00